MRTVRRLYFYAVAFVSLEVVLWGLIGLARSLFHSASIATIVPADGKPIWEKYCATCHGATGKGDGPGKLAEFNGPNAVAAVPPARRGD